MPQYKFIYPSKQSRCIYFSYISTPTQNHKKLNLRIIKGAIILVFIINFNSIHIDIISHDGLVSVNRTTPMINATHHHIIVISVAINPSRSIIEPTAVDLIATTVGRRHEIDDLVQRLESGA